MRLPLNVASDCLTKLVLSKINIKSGRMLTR